MRQLRLPALAMGLAAVPLAEAGAQPYVIEALSGPVPAATREIAAELAGPPSRPNANFQGLAQVFRTFAGACLAMDDSTDPMAALPDGYVRTGFVAYTLGEPVAYEETTYTLTPTGDADADMAGGYVTVLVTEDDAGAISCRIDWPLRPGFDSDAAARMAQMLQVHAAYEFRAIPLGPPSGRRSPYPTELGGYQTLARVCGETWCELVVTWGLQPDRSDPFVSLGTRVAPGADARP